MADGFRLTSLGRDVLNRYRGAGLSARTFLNLRWRWTPYEEIARRISTHGVILDLGSGHGLLSLAMALSEPTRIVRGFDHDEKRVDMARKAAAGLANVEFSSGGIRDIVADPGLRGQVAGIVVIDALHYLTFAEQEAFLADARNALRPGGALLIRDVDAAAGNNFLVNRLHERIMTGIGFTRAEQLNFRTRADWLLMLAKAGFEAACEPCSRFPFADLLFTSTAPAAEIKKVA